MAAYCATFLKPEMQHIYRQIVGLQRYRCVVIARKIEGATQFPFSPVAVVRKPWHHELRRFWFRTLLKRAMTVSAGEGQRILRHIASFCADVFHVYFGNIGAQLVPVLRACPAPAVVSFHGADVRVDLQGPRELDLLRKAMDAATLVLGRSQSLLDALRQLGCSPDKLRLNRTGIPLESYPFERRKPPRDGRWRFLQACRLVEKKGVETTLRAFAQVASEYPLARLVIAGTGPLGSVLADVAAQLGIADRVDFAGFMAQDALREQLYRSHIFVHPSESPGDGNQEGVPNGLLEAMASGLPCISTRHGGIPEAIDDGVAGLLCDERDAPGVAQAMRSLLENEPLRTRLSEAGAASVREQFDARKQIAVLESLYDEAIARHRPDAQRSAGG